MVNISVHEMESADVTEYPAVHHCATMCTGGFGVGCNTVKSEEYMGKVWLIRLTHIHILIHTLIDCIC